jgi:hypothetical protein
LGRGPEADIVGVVTRATPGGADIDRAGDTEARLADQIRWVREAAGERFSHLELAALTWGVAITDDQSTAAERMAARLRIPVEQVLASPYFLIGSVDAIVECLVAQRERYGISYISVFPPDMEAFAPVVARLAGT